MFQRSISSEELAKKEKPTSAPKFSAHHNSVEKNVWLYVGVGVVMAVFFFFWIQILPSQIQTQSASGESQSFFEKSKQNLADIFNTEKKQVDQLKESIATILNRVSSSSSAASSTALENLATSTPELSDKQIDELKKIIKKK